MPTTDDSTAPFIFTEVPTEEEIFHSLRCHQPVPGFVFQSRDGKTTGAMEITVTSICYGNGDVLQWWFTGIVSEIRQKGCTVKGPRDAIVSGLWKAEPGSYASRFPSHEFALEENLE